MSLPIIPVTLFGSIGTAPALRLNGTDERMSRTAAVNTAERRKHTWSVWIRPNVSGTTRPVFTVRNAGNGAQLYLGTDNKWRHDETDGLAGDTINAQGSSSIPQDQWTHIVEQYDSTVGTAAARIVVYVNGVAETMSYSGGNTPDSSQSSSFGLTLVHSVGWHQNGGTFWPGDLALFHWVDGSIVAPTVFADVIDGVYQAKRPTGLSYGNNGHYLDFSLSASLGEDADGAQDYTLTNIDSTNSIGDGPPFST